MSHVSVETFNTENQSASLRIVAEGVTIIDATWTRAGNAVSIAARPQPVVAPIGALQEVNDDCRRFARGVEERFGVSATAPPGYSFELEKNAHVAATIKIGGLLTKFEFDPATGKVTAPPRSAGVMSWEGLRFLFDSVHEFLRRATA